ncbi:hypothetical protein BDA96_02G085200 [Sorghum bicolor]|uniref:Uncharacterized protein n=1 Tax=Sorghum bicolor TaxID=4558 RepID=A0A921RMK6_SORBI|nr:hypothetical protein BDA96_02G085200 [Sorghum bicolor]KAG0542226.1 hypothetical protein BDA96_02G085200 [Sorghum bicolor]
MALDVSQCHDKMGLSNRLILQILSLCLSHHLAVLQLINGVLCSSTADQKQQSQASRAALCSLISWWPVAPNTAWLSDIYTSSLAITTSIPSAMKGSADDWQTAGVVDKGG